ncbi:DMT family transporter [Clostridium sp. DJ247]|uniref:DMT family transporter n=1 Tax=Clostridium sp. DJ247 TaxID=2726188 RepID=UPI001625D4E0|nr:DMT family transporter [Clostridium sp. DJ247]MBC2582704.1 DMT family transporter [Clostridium sp. DJ247]
MKEIMPYVLAIVAGIFTTLEASINSQLGKAINPKVATLHSLLVGLLVMLIVNILSGTLSEYSKVLNVRLQWLIGGIFGALTIYFVTKTVPKLGITITLTMVIAAQILSSFYIDIVVLKHQRLEITKIFGVFLIIAGVYFISE